jgi:two-component system, NtrC family, C4-dicarboxylate transport response regulator DctD
MKRGLIYLVDDDADLLASVTDWLDASGFAAQAFDRAEDALAAVAAVEPDVLVTDLRMPGMDGFALLERLRGGWPDLPVIVITGHGDVPQAVRAIRSGAQDFLEKPYDADHFVTVLDRAVAQRGLHRELNRLRALVAGPGGAIIGESPAVMAMHARIAALAPLALSVLVIGETGSGKELAARALHAAGPHAAGPFVALDCAAIPEALFEVEVFGHAAGAFPNAGAARAGRIEAAQGGTLYLDEVEAIPPAIQPKLLRLLEERTVTRLGENTPRPINIRVMAAAKSDLSEDRAAGRFRDDLYFRLAEVDLPVPSLRARPGDAVLLFSHFAALAAARYGQTVPTLAAEAMQALQDRPWPGNVRELKALAERVTLGLETLDGARSGPEGEGLADRVAAFEAREIRAALARAGGSTAKAALLLDVPRRTLADKMARLGLREG